MKPTPEEKQQGIEKYHAAGQASGAAGKDHSTPHGVPSLFLSGSKEAAQQLLDENQAFEAGWENGRKQR